MTTDIIQPEFESLKRLTKEHDNLEETATAYECFLDYIHMGSQRSLRGLWGEYSERLQKNDKARTPATNYNQITEWSAKYKWQARLKGYVEEKGRLASLVELELIQAYKEQAWGSFNKLATLVDDMIGEFEQLRKTRIREIADPNTGQQIRVITLRVNTRDLRELVQAQGQLRKDLRTILGVPNQQQIDITSKGRPLKGYIGFSPEEWAAIQEATEGKTE